MGEGGRKASELGCQAGALLLRGSEDELRRRLTQFTRSAARELDQSGSLTWT